MKNCIATLRVYAFTHIAKMHINACCAEKNHLRILELQTVD